MIPSDNLYSKEHEWLRAEGDLYLLGITAFAQEELGEVVFVELPDVGQRYETGDEIGTIESVKAVAEIYTPVAGEIVAINEALEDKPESVNEDPYTTGWLIKLRPDDAEAVKALMSAETYQAFLDSEDG